MTSGQDSAVKTDCHRGLMFENSPVKPGVDGETIKTFEEFLDLSLKNIQDEDSIIQDERTVPKKPFLRKGTGLARFNPVVKQKKPCLVRDSNNNETRRKFQRSLFDAQGDGVEILPKISSRITSQLKNVAVIQREHLKQSSTARVQKTKKKQEPKEQSSSLENLERLLYSVRDRKQQVLQRLQEEVDQEGSDCSSSSSWESDEEENSEEDRYRSICRRNQNQKKVRWNKKSTKHLKGHRSSKYLSEASPGPYSLHLMHCIRQLEDKLDDLKSKSQRQDSPTRRHLTRSPSKSEEKLVDETVILKKEISELNEKILGLTEGLKTLQVLTGKVVSSSSGQNKRTKVTVHHNPSLARKETVISQDIPVDNRNKTKESVVHFENGCRMQVLPDNTVVHIFSNGTKQSSFPDGSKLIEFPSGQTERTLANGIKYISYPNQSHRIIHLNGSEELTMSDGTVLRISPDGTEVVILPNGEREIRSKEFTRREYRSGIVKTVYADGTQETRYPNGRLRIKDKFNHLVVDSMVRPLDQI